MLSFLGPAQGWGGEDPQTHKACAPSWTSPSPSLRLCPSGESRARTPSPPHRVTMHTLISFLTIQSQHQCLGTFPHIPSCTEERDQQAMFPDPPGP